MNNTGQLVRLSSSTESSKSKIKVTKSISSVLSYSLVYGGVVFILTAFIIITFLFMLDLNQLRKDTIEDDMIFQFVFDEGSPVIDRIDENAKPYLKKFLKLLHYNSNVKYNYDRQR